MGENDDNKNPQSTYPMFKKFLGILLLSLLFVLPFMPHMRALGMNQAPLHVVTIALAAYIGVMLLRSFKSYLCFLQIACAIGSLEYLLHVNKLTFDYRWHAFDFCLVVLASIIGWRKGALQKQENLVHGNSPVSIGSFV